MSQRLPILGDYERGDHRSSADRGRYLFLKAVSKCEPEVLRDLIQGAPGECFSELPPELGQGLTWSSFHPEKGTVPLGRSLVSWGERWHLLDDWCLDQALHLLSLWAWPFSEYESDSGEVSNDIGPDWANRVSLATFASREEIHFRFEHPGGDLAIQTKREIKEEISKAFKRCLKSYLDRIESLAKARDYTPVLKKDNLTHFEMLARYQVQGWTHSKIAGCYRYKDTSTVAHLIPETAKLIGLTLRKGRGRPRKKPRS